MECSVTGTTTLDREWHRPIIRRFFIFSVSLLLMAICTNCGCLISCRNCLPFTSTWVLTLHEHMSSYPSRAPEFLPFTSTWVLTLHEHMSSYPSRAPEFLPFASTWVLTLHEHPSSYPSRTHEFLPFTSTWVLTLREHLSSPRLLVESVLLIFLVFCVAFLILFVFVLYLVYPILLVSLDCPFLISPSVFSNVYLKW
jgi:hypothetical protein